MRIWADAEGAAPTLRPYTVRNGVAHLLKEDKLADAVKLLHASSRPRMVSRSTWCTAGPRRVCDRVGSIFTAEAAGRGDPKTGARGLLDREASRIDPQQFLRLIIGFYEIDPLFNGIKLLYRYHQPAWPGLFRYLLAEDDMIVRYTLAQAMADAFLETGSDATLAAIRELAADPRLDEREVGAYALKFVVMRRPDLIDPGFLRQLAEGRSTYDRTIAAETLVHLAMGGHRPTDYVPASATTFWRPLSGTTIAWRLTTSWLPRRSTRGLSLLTLQSGRRSISESEARTVGVGSWPRFRRNGGLESRTCSPVMIFSDGR